MASTKDDTFTRYQECKNPGKKDFLTDKSKVYKLTAGGELELIEGEVRKEVDPYAEKMKSNVVTPLMTPSRIEDYPIGEALYAPIGHAIVVKGQGKYKFIGTDGLNGCVEVMLECKSVSGNVYLVAHVSSAINEDSVEIMKQLEVMRQAVNEYLEEEVTWADFGLHKDSKGKMRLVRSSGGYGDQLLYQNMIRQLLDLGASLKEHVSNSLTMDISVPEARYFDNDLAKPKPKNIDQRGIDGYPFPE